MRIQSHDFGIFTDAELLNCNIISGLVGLFAPKNVNPDAEYSHVRDLVTTDAKYSLRRAVVLPPHIDLVVKALRSGKTACDVAAMCDGCLLYGIPWISAPASKIYKK